MILHLLINRLSILFDLRRYISKDLKEKTDQINVDENYPFHFFLFKKLCNFILILSNNTFGN